MTTFTTRTQPIGSAPARGDSTAVKISMGGEHAIAR